MYPVGRFENPGEYSREKADEMIRRIEKISPFFAQNALELSSEQLRKSYRPGGWNAIQVIHHVADSHMNAFIRFKLALTEHEPIIKPFNEKKWCDLTDAREGGISSSLQILSGLHYRWVLLLKGMTEKDFGRSVFHPEENQIQSLFFLLAYYAWHGDHHLGHLKLIKNQ
ncbi:MAG: putative metal-dependent hydrolase [Flavobacteriaceae bacterium]|nr:putative metal-dependent hydrolase [Flavobacteriaceae bacterium]